MIVVAVVVAWHEVGLARLARRSRHSRTVERRRRSFFFYGGLAVLLLAVVSPIDYWADDYFFAHMIEHILIMFFAPILIVAGAPWLPLVHAFPVAVRRRFGRAVLLGTWARPLRALGRFVTNGVFAVVLFNVVMVTWHLPARRARWSTGSSIGSRSSLCRSSPVGKAARTPSGSPGGLAAETRWRHASATALGFLHCS